MAVAVTGWTSSSLGARSPGLRSRQIVLVLSVGMYGDEETRGGVGRAEAARCGNGEKGTVGLCQ